MRVVIRMRRVFISFKLLSKYHPVDRRQDGAPRMACAGVHEAAGGSEDGSALRTSKRLSFLDVPAVLDLARFHDIKLPHVKALWRAVVRDGASDLAAAGSAAGVPEACTALLEETCAVTTSTVTQTSPSGADKGFKLVVRLASGKRVETVAIVHTAPSGTQGRITVCVSSQVGCKMGCTFCATGTMGFQGDLSAGEILEQVPLHTRTPALTPHPDAQGEILSRCCTWSEWRPPSVSTGA